MSCVRGQASVCSTSRCSAGATGHRTRAPLPFPSLSPSRPCPPAPRSPLPWTQLPYQVQCCWLWVPHVREVHGLCSHKLPGARDTAFFISIGSRTEPTLLFSFFLKTFLQYRRHGEIEMVRRQTDIRSEDWRYSNLPQPPSPPQEQVKGSKRTLCCRARI